MTNKCKMTFVTLINAST